MIIIDGITYDVNIVSLDETCDFLDKYAERTENGKLQRELIGCYFNQRLVFGAPVTTAERTEMAALWNKLTEATEFHEVTVPDEDGISFTFNAYFANVTRSLRKEVNAKTFWQNMTVNFIAEEPAITP